MARPKRGLARTIKKSLYVEMSSDEDELGEGPYHGSSRESTTLGAINEEQERANVGPSILSGVQKALLDAQGSGSRQDSAKVAGTGQRTARNEVLERILGFKDDDSGNETNDPDHLRNALSFESIERSFTRENQQASPPQRSRPQRPQQRTSSPTRLEPESSPSFSSPRRSSLVTRTGELSLGPTRKSRESARNDLPRTPRAKGRKRKSRAQNGSTPSVVPALQGLESAMSFIPTSQQRYMRACMVCSIVRTEQQFKASGCPNCEAFLELTNNADQIQDCTSQVFEGLMTVADTNKSWVARYQRLEGYVPGVYAVQVEGVLPEEAITAAENAGVNYIPRDGSMSETLPVDG